MVSLQEHLDETRAAQERVDKHLTRRSATESSILKEVLTLVTLYGKLGESLERIEGKLDQLMDSEEEQEPGLFDKTVNMPRPFASDQEKMESYTRGRERREAECGAVYLPGPNKASLKCTYLANHEGEHSWSGQYDADWKHYYGETQSGAYVTTSWPEDPLDKRFASYKPYGPPPGFPDEDESYGDAS